MQHEVWQCISCTWMILDSEGEAGIENEYELNGETTTDTPCPRCGGRMVKVGQ